MAKSCEDLGDSGRITREALAAWAASGRRGIVTISGGSMRPLFRPGSKVVVEPVTEGVRVGIAEVVNFAPDVQGLKSGDMVAYKSQVATTEFDLGPYPVRVVRRQDILNAVRRRKPSLEAV